MGKNKELSRAAKMDKSQNIPVEKVTKPIQLLAAWLTGLIIIDASFLTAANTLTAPTWAVGLLVLAAVLNVPAFLAAIFLLQTKFRPEMQEDTFYSKYLESKTGSSREPINTSHLAKVKEELFFANTKTLEIVSELQAEIKNLSFRVENGVAKAITGPESGVLERKIQDAVDVSAWNVYQIRLNKYIKDTSAFKKTLIEANIPIHSTFGNTNLMANEPPEIVIGSGFQRVHLKCFLNAIAKQNVGTVAFAYPEGDGEELDTYEREILIGAYNNHGYGLALKEAVELINNDAIDIESFYSAIKT